MKSKCTRRILCLLVCAFILIPQLALGSYETLKLGGKGAHVLRMQQALDGLGYTLSADGIFGPATQAVVRAFQRAQGLTVDGKAGNQTLTRLYQLTGTTPAGGETSSPDQQSVTPTPAPPPALTSHPNGANGVFATVAGGRLKMRKGASTSSSLIATIPDKARVVVTGYGTEWSQVTYGRYKGYAMTQYLSFDPSYEPARTPTPTFTPDPAAEPTPTPYWAFAPGNGYAYVTGGSLKMRRMPNAAAYITILPDKTRVVYIEKGGEWTKIIHGTLTGYVMTKYLVFDAAATPTPTPGGGE